MAFGVDGSTSELIFYITMFFCFVIFLSEAVRYAVSKQKGAFTVMGLAAALCGFANLALPMTNVQILLLAISIIAAIYSVIW